MDDADDSVRVPRDRFLGQAFTGDSACGERIQIRAVRFFSFFLAIYAIVGGTLGLVGWLADIPRLTDWGAVGIAMLPNTCVMAVLGGAALFLQIANLRGTRTVVIVLGSALALVAGATLFEHLSGLNLGIDTLLVKPAWGEKATVSPGRPGPPASVAFTLLGAAFLVVNTRTRRLASILAIVVSAISMVSLVGYFFNAEVLFATPRFTGIALQTASILMALSFGIVGSMPDIDPMRTLAQQTSAGVLARRGLPFAVFMPIILAWIRLQGQEVGLYDTVTGLAIMETSLTVMLSILMWWCVTIVRKNELKIIEGERRLAELIHALPAPVYTTDAEGFVTLYNPAVVNAVGREPQLGRDRWCVAEKLFWPDGAPMALEESPMARSLQTGRAVCGQEFILERADGQRSHLISYPTPLRDAEGRLSGAINMLIDITDRKKFETQLERANTELKHFTATLEERVEERTAQLEEQSEQLRRLAVQLTQAEERERKRLAEILHDHLQQLLVAAKMRLELPQGKPGSAQNIDETRKLIEEAYAASRTLTAELRPPVLYESGLGPALRFLARKFADQYKFKVDLSISPDAEPATSLIRSMIYQFVQELMTNAMKYGGTMECTVTLGRLANGDVRVTVRDQGVGFDAESIGRKGSGGFGLFGIRERVKALGGTFTLDTGPNRGTLFEIVIPDDASLAPATATEALLKEEILLEEKRRKEHEGAITVLLADDHKILRQSLATVLEKQPFIHEVLESENGRDAVALARETHPDVVLMDLNMPYMNGIEATRALHRTNPEIKIVGLSVQTERETAQAMMDAGAVLYLNKSEDVNILINALKDFALESGTPSAN